MTRGFYLRVMVILVAALSAWTVLWPSIPRIAPPWVTRLVKSRLNMGLDIRGGARLSYDVQIGAAIAQVRDQAIENIRDQLSRDFSFHRGEGRMTDEAAQRLTTKVTVRRNEVENRELTIQFVNAADATKVDDKFLRDRGLTQRSRNGATIVAAVPQEQVEQIEERAVKEAVQRISQRIDELAIKEVSITSRGETIVVEVPGSDQAYFDQIRDIIRRTARLEFRLCADSAEILEDFRPGGPKAERMPEGVRLEQEPGVSAGTRADGSANTAAPLHFTAQGPDGLRKLKEFVATIRAEIPDNYDLLVGEDDRESRRTRQPVPTERKLWRTYTVEHIAHVTGDSISSAEVGIKQDVNQPYVSLTFRPDGTRAFAQITRDNVKERFAIVLDDRVMSAPVIQEPIENGSASITVGGGDFRSQMREADELMIVLRAGALPAPLSEGTMDFIGPTLGKDTISSALRSAGIGVALVMVFMAVWYGWAGLIANAAVLLNVLLQIAAIAFLGATLTLPGFAGLALTVGMAVDSNVLINERIKEELRSGKGVRAAVDAGYEHAFSAIFDGHVTTFISGVVLLQYGTGPVKGFAVTLLIGIVANLFTGVFATRVVFDWLVRGLKVKRLSLK